jgi:aminoglycoside phosphotransferase family enzyme/predicted kinase
MVRPTELPEAPHMPIPAAADDIEEREVTAFLSDPATYGAPRVDVIETHVARVFLAGDEAYKVKKRVRLPFVDFSTLEARRRAAVREIELNQPYAPALYLGLRPITREADGRLRLGGEGEVIDWVVHMHRFDQEALLASEARKGPLPDPLSKALAAMAARYHRACPVASGLDGAQVIARVVRQLTTALAGAAAARAFLDRLAALLESTGPLLTRRGRAGAIRRCHGDLHLGNIVLIDGAPVPFDALEFSEELATIDVLYDLAFLLMDLDYRGDRHAANIVLNSYARAAPVGQEIEGLACLPLFLACRAGVRAVVAIERSGQLEREDQEEQKRSAQRYLELAATFLNPPPPALVAVGGLSGTGKSTLAAGLASLIGPAPGALHLRSDIERKRLFGVPETERLKPEHYRAKVSEETYAQLLDKARRALVAGHAVIVDAVFARPAERAAIEAVARQLHRPFAGLWLAAPSETLFARVEARHGDASDADRAVVNEQLSYDIGEIAWLRIDAGGTPLQSLEKAKKTLRAAGISLKE